MGCRQTAWVTFTRKGDKVHLKKNAIQMIGSHGFF